MKIYLGEFGTHGCPRSITVVKAADGSVFIAESNEPCYVCGKGAAFNVSMALRAHRAEIAAMTESLRIDHHYAIIGAASPVAEP